MGPLAGLFFLFIISLRSRVAAQDPSIQLSGPTWMYSCQTADFSWQGGQPPFTFRTWTSETLDDYFGVRPIVTNLTNIILTPLVQDTQWAFQIEDANHAQSNPLSIGVLESQCDLGTNDTLPSGYTPMHNANPPAITPTATVVWGTTTAVKATLWTPYVQNPISYLTSDGITIVVSHMPTSSANAASTVVVSPTSTPVTKSMGIPIWAVAVTATIGGLLVFLCSGFFLCWWKRRSRLRKKGVYGASSRSWKRHPRKGDRLSRNELRNGSKSADLLANTSNPALMEEATPLSTPFQSSTVISLSDTPTHVPPPAMFHTLPSSKELRERKWESRRSTDMTSISDMSEPISSVPPASEWPENTEDGSEHLEATTSESPHRSRRSRPSPRDPRSLQALISRELEQILQDPQRSASRSSLPDTDISPISLTWTKTTGEGSADEKTQLSLQIPTTPQSGNDSAYLQPSSAGLSKTPISRRDMELLADMVAARLARDRVRHSVDAPPPSYS